MFKFFSKESLRVMMFSQEEARRVLSQEVQPEHILAGLIRSNYEIGKPEWCANLPDSKSSGLMRDSGISVDKIRAAISTSSSLEIVGPKIPFSQKSRELLIFAQKYSKKQDSLEIITTVHLLFACVEMIEESLLLQMGLVRNDIKNKIQMTLDDPTFKENS